MSKSLLRSFFQGSMALRSFSIIAIFCLVGISAQSQTVKTDMQDYLPGDIVHITGEGWFPGSTVRLVIEHSTYSHTSTIIDVAVQSDGTFSDQSYKIEDYHLGETFTLTASGYSASEEYTVAQTTFTDGCARFASDGELKASYAFCSSGGTISIDIQFTGGGSDVSTLKWFKNNVELSSTSISTGGIKSLIVAPEVPLTLPEIATYKVQVIKPGCATSPLESTTTVRFLPTESPAFSFSIIDPCNNPEMQLSGSTQYAEYVLQEDKNGVWTEINNTLKIGTGNALTWGLTGNGLVRVYNRTCGVASNSVNTQNGGSQTEINTAPQNQTVCPLADVTFTVSASGTNLSYKWYKNSVVNGAEIGTNVSLVLNDVSQSSEGTYIVVVQGCGNSVQASATLTVYDPVTAGTPMVDATKCPGESVTFTANYTGSGLQYAWYKGSVAPANLLSETSASLTINPIAEANEGTYIVVVKDNCNNSLQDDATLIVNAPTVISVQTPETIVSIEYGCTRPQFEVTATGEGTVEYKWFVKVNSGSWTELTGQITSKYVVPELLIPGVYEYKVEVKAVCGTISNTNTWKVTIIPQTANPAYVGEAYYTGPVATLTTSNTSSTATFTMSAFVQNSSLENCGDIATARVSFLYRISTTDPNAPYTKVPNGQNLPVNYVDPSAPSLGGTASVIAQLNIGTGTSEVYDIKVVISGNYKGSPDKEFSQVTVTRAQPAGTISGGTKLHVSSSTGAATGFIKPACKSELGFYVTYTLKSGKAQNPKGKVSVIVKSYYNRFGSLTPEIHHYKLTSNAIASLTFGTGGTATFSGKANIVEINSDNTLTNIEGNCTMVLNLKDVTCGENKVDDVGIVIYRNSGGIWYSNNYTTKGITEPTDIACGDICVSGTVCPVLTSIPVGTLGASLVTDEINARPTAIATELSAKIFPNPSTNVFNLTFTGGTKEKLDVTVMDVSGRTVKSYKVDPIGTFRFGDSLRPGIYMIQVKQGTSNRVFKVIKQ